MRGRVSRQRVAWACTVYWDREEALGFVPIEVSYRISGTVTPYRPATRIDPEEGGEVEITCVERADDDFWDEVPMTEWPFDPVEIAQIENEIGVNAEDSREIDLDYYDEDR